MPAMKEPATREFSQPAFGSYAKANSSAATPRPSVMAPDQSMARRSTGGGDSGTSIAMITTEGISKASQLMNTQPMLDVPLNT